MTVYNEVVLYHTWETLEWGTKYYWGGTLPPTYPTILALSEAEATLIKATININRYEVFSATGVKIDEGDLGTNPGALSDNMANIHYALLLREAAPAVKRPSVKYIHGYGINAFTPDGELSSAYQTLIANFGSFMAGEQWVDSDGGNITGMIFRGFSRRKKMRQISQ